VLSVLDLILISVPSADAVVVGNELVVARKIAHCSEQAQQFVDSCDDPYVFCK
jgi:hypothetical protein